MPLPENSSGAPSPAIPTSGPRLRRGWYAGVICAVVGAFGWQIWSVLMQGPEEIRAQVPVTTVWGLHACAILGCAALFLVGPRLWTVFGRARLLKAAVLAVLGYAACGLAPKINRIFYDEHIYMQIGQTIAHTDRAAYASYARTEYGEFDIYDTWVNKQPNGHPYLLGWWFRIWGASEDSAHQLVRVEVGLAAALLYLALAAAPFGLPAGAGLAAAVALIFTPVVLWWGHTVAVEPAALFTTVGAIAAAMVFLRLRDECTGAASPAGATILATAVAAAVYFRPESLLVFPVVALLLVVADPRLLRDRATWAALGLAVALAMPQLLHHWCVRGEDWGAGDNQRFGGGYLLANLRSNLAYFISGHWFPRVGSVLALVGAAWLLWRRRGLGMAVGLWFLLAWGVFVFFYAGGYHYGASSRYAVISAAPVAVLVGLGSAAAWAKLRSQPALAGVAGALVLMSWTAGMNVVPTLERESCEARADLDWTRAAARELPHGSLVICSSTGVWMMLGCNAAQPGSIDGMVRENLAELVRQYPGGVYLHWDYWANVQPDIAANLEGLLQATGGKLIRLGRFENYRFALYRLDRGPVPAMPHGRALLGEPADEAMAPMP